jgi:hypothetical protein
MNNLDFLSNLDNNDIVSIDENLFFKIDEDNLENVELSNEKLYIMHIIYTFNNTFSILRKNIVSNKEYFDILNKLNNAYDNIYNNIYLKSLLNNNKFFEMNMLIIDNDLEYFERFRYNKCNRIINNIYYNFNNFMKYIRITSWIVHSVNYDINIRSYISDSESDDSEYVADVKSDVESDDSDDSVDNHEIDEDGNILVDKKED